MKNSDFSARTATTRGARAGVMLLGLLAASNAAHAECNANIAPTRPYSRYELVAGATPIGSEVRDKVTGLVWQRCVVGMEWNGSTCTGTASTLTWTSALDAARTATASTAAAATTWRLPNLNELASLAEWACLAPAINTAWFPATPSAYTASSSPVTFYGALVWYVGFLNGINAAGPSSGVNVVRLVRSGQ